MHRVGEIFPLLYNQEHLLREYKQNRLPSICQSFYKTMGDIGPLKINDEFE